MLLLQAIYDTYKKYLGKGAQSLLCFRGTRELRVEAT